MRNRRWRYVLVFSLKVLSGLAMFAHAGDSPDPKLLAQREQFLLLEKNIEVMQKRDPKGLDTELASLSDYPLLPYLTLQTLSERLASLPVSDVDRFFSRYAGTPLETTLRKRWLTELAKQSLGKQYIEAYQPHLGTVYTCHYLNFQLAETENPAFWLEQVNDIWLSGQSRPDECDPVFKLWRRAGMMTIDMVMARAELVAKEGNTQLLGYLQSRLPQTHHYLIGLWRQIKRNPVTVTRYPSFPLKYTEYELPVIYYGITRLAWQDPNKAIRAFSVWQKKIEFSEPQLQQIYRAIAISLAIDNDEKAMEWLAKANVPAADSDVRHWHLAYMLRQHDWQGALGVIDSAPTQEQADEAFRYWRARGIGELDASAAQNQLFGELANERNYYGFLASARLAKQPDLATQPLTVSDALLAKVSLYPAVKRAKEWFELSRYVEARREWSYLNKKLNKDEKQAATILASNWGWYDQAIFGFARTGHFDDVERRFPLAFADQFQQQASQHKVDPAMAMAIARRESSFMVDAVSPAGARGLMQLMPDTANYLTSSRVGTNTLFEPDKNVSLGIQYLKYLNDKLGENPVLVTASYNAGWQRVMQWLPAEGEQPLDVWIENIPYRETRHYVKAVMAYRYIYQKQLGQSSDLFDTLSRMKVSADSLTLP
ncbi:transglycosylase SLT domain-containing protein [Aestuariibacter sp. GS-14]|uniref:transglycosylase SLT domain-containing protein n=1 Tax=Aestuariibacter sp. GS-14 TaxID=2590670 RepID=UPI0015E85881|nr:transglycosylase SLT domain-containing protein [Aestuariibacter sp. GS-14]